MNITLTEFEYLKDKKIIGKGLNNLKIYPKYNLLSFLEIKDIEKAKKLNIISADTNLKTIFKFYLNHFLPDSMQTIYKFLTKNPDLSFKKDLMEFYNKYNCETVVDNKILDFAFITILTHLIKINTEKKILFSSLMNIIDFIKNINFSTHAKQERLNDMLIDSDNSQVSNEYVNFLENVYQIINHFSTPLNFLSVLQTFENYQNQLQNEQNEEFLFNFNDQLKNLINNLFNFHEQIKHKINDLKTYTTNKELICDFSNINHLKYLIKDYIQFKTVYSFLENIKICLDNFLFDKENKSNTKEYLEIIYNNKIVKILEIIKNNGDNNFVKYENCKTIYKKLLELEKLSLSNGFESLQIKKTPNEKQEKCLLSNKRKNPDQSRKKK
jgi:hypothetical protein